MTAWLTERNKAKTKATPSIAEVAPTFSFFHEKKSPFFRMALSFKMQWPGHHSTKENQYLNSNGWAHARLFEIVHMTILLVDLCSKTSTCIPVVLKDIRAAGESYLARGSPVSDHTRNPLKRVFLYGPAHFWLSSEQILKRF